MQQIGNKHVSGVCLKCGTTDLDISHLYHDADHRVSEVVCGGIIVAVHSENREMVLEEVVKLSNDKLRRAGLERKYAPIKKSPEMAV